MPLSFHWSAQISDVFVVRRPLLFFFRFKRLVHAVEDAVRLLVVASLNVTLVLVVDVVVVVVVVNIISLADVQVLFLHAPVLTPTVAISIVALFLS